MFDSRQLNCMIRDRTATITPTSRPCQGFLVALYRTYRYAYLWWPGVEVADETMVAPHFFRGALVQLRIRFLRLPGVESTDETVKLSHYVSAVLVFAVARPDTMEETAIATQPGSAMLSFTPLPIGSPVKGSRQLCCRGVDSY